MYAFHPAPHAWCTEASDGNMRLKELHLLKTARGGFMMLVFAQSEVMHTERPGEHACCTYRETRRARLLHT